MACRTYPVWLALAGVLVACGGDDDASTADAATPATDATADAVDAAPLDAGGCAVVPADATPLSCGTGTQSNIEHLVVIVQENHSFDSYFGRYCTAATGSNPTCTTGPSCCEAGPDRTPGNDTAPLTLDDTTNGAFDPNHYYDCNLDEINGGAMDRFIEGLGACADARNFAYAEPTGPIAPYVAYAQSYAIADRYFQPVLGQSSSNDMYLARAAFVFKDNEVGTTSIGGTCGFGVTSPMDYDDPTLADLLNDCGVSWAWYSAGYDAMVTAVAADDCPARPDDCPVLFQTYPCVYDPTDVPFQYYPSLQDKPAYFKDLTKFSQDVTDGTLPAISFLKPIGYRTEHPGFNDTISDGVTVVTGLVDQVLASSTYQDNTLILVVYDEGGGYFDHVPPPPTSTIDCAPYGVRAVFMALGPMTKTNYVSHVTMEHSSIVKFIEWNWFGGETGQLGTRDTTVNNLGDLLDPAKTGATVP